MRKRLAGALIVLLTVARLVVPAPLTQTAAACTTDWSARWNSQSPSEVAGREGELIQLWIWYQNMGCRGWGFSTPARIGTWNPEPGQDANSYVGGSGSGCASTGWPFCDRVQQYQSTVDPGAYAEFTMYVWPPPGGVGSYRLYMRPVIDGITWMEDYGVWWQVDVAAPVNTGCTQTGRSVATPDPAIQFISWTDCYTSLRTYDNHNANALKFGGQNQGGCHGTDSPFFTQAVTGSVTYHNPYQNWGAYQASDQGRGAVMCSTSLVWGSADTWNQPIPASAATDGFRSVTIFSQWTCGAACTPNYAQESRDYYFP